MPSDDLHGSPNDRPATEAVGPEFDAGLLGSLLEETPANDLELSGLLARLDSADTVAGGVEAKLDGILGTLDDLLRRLEPMPDDKPHEATTSHSGSQSEQS